MKIPTKFKVYDSEVKVILSPDLIKDFQCSGQYFDSSSTIKLQTVNEVFDIYNQEISFVHELIHCLLESIGEYKLSQNEKFVELFARVLKQAINTMEYDNYENN